MSDITVLGQLRMKQLIYQYAVFIKKEIVSLESVVNPEVYVVLSTQGYAKSMPIMESSQSMAAVTPVVISGTLEFATLGLTQESV